MAISRLISAFIVLLLAVIPLHAQWVHYPTPGIPRTPDGKPNLSAPAPRTAIASVSRVPASAARFSRSRAYRDAEDRACQEIAERIQTRLASFFYAGS